MATFDPENNKDRFLRSLGTRQAGERNETVNDGTDYMSVVNEATYTVVSGASIAADTTTVISSSPAILYGYIVTTVIGGSVSIAIQDASTTIVSIPDGTAADTYQSYTQGIRFETSLNVNPNAASTGEIIVLWRLI